MKLLQLQEATYANAKTVERVMNYVEEDSSIQEGFAMKINRLYDSTIHYIQYLSVQNYDDPDEDDHGNPYMLVSYFGEYNQSDIFDPEEFIEAVEIYSTKRIL